VKRRAILAALVGLGAAAMPAAVRGQAPPLGKTYRIGFIATYAPQGPKPSHLLAALLEGLRELGYSDGQNLVLDRRYYEGKPEKLPMVARELADSKPDVIVTSVNVQTNAAKAATQTIPIVMIVGTDVVEAGFVSSLARPGGNITGLTWDVGIEIMPKRFELLKEMLPHLSRVAVLWDPGQDAPAFEQAIRQGAEAIGVTLIWIDLRGASDFGPGLEQAFAQSVREGAQAVFTGGGSRLFGHRKQVVALAAKYRLPDTHYSGEFVEAGGLMAYAPNLPAMFKRSAVYIDKILRGAKPADLPVERPVRIDLLVNLRTAQVLGLTVPQSILLRADRVIE